MFWFFILMGSLSSRVAVHRLASAHFRIVMPPPPLPVDEIFARTSSYLA